MDIIPNDLPDSLPERNTSVDENWISAKIEECHLIGGAASFTDDTSLPNVPFVSIHAQVLAEACDLGWFDLMRSMSGAAPGAEFKKAAIEHFFSQACIVQLSLLNKIGSQARIHIVDPRPHILVWEAPSANGFQMVWTCSGFAGSWKIQQRTSKASANSSMMESLTASCSVRPRSSTS